jgi:putative Holliday junction resolvase
MPRILALDVGEKRIGVAISDDFCIIAQALETISDSSEEKKINRILELVKKYNVKTIVVGMPLNLKGEVAQKAKKVKKFIKKLDNNLKKISSVDIVEEDERFTTVIAHRTIHSLGKSPSKQKEDVDKLSAVFILRTYLDRVNLQSSKNLEG